MLKVFLVSKFKSGGSFVMSLEGNCHEVEVAPNLELLVTFGMSLEGVCNELQATKNSSQKAPP